MQKYIYRPSCCLKQGQAGLGFVRKAGFTLMELVLSIAIILTLLAIIIPTVGNYIQKARKTADKQTLVVLNDALNKYKTQGGDLSALTAGADIDNVLATLKTPITYWGLSQQFLNTSAPYAAADISAGGNGVGYVFTRYGSYMDMAAFLGAIKGSYAIADPDFDSWLEQAFIETGTTNYAVFTNPDTTQLFGLYAQVESSGDKVRVWWGDGTTQDFDSIQTNSSTTITKDFGSAAERTIVMVGDISFIRSDDLGGLGGSGSTYFGGNISTMKSLTYFYCTGRNTIGGDVADFPEGLDFLELSGNNTVSGNVANLPRGLTHLRCAGYTTITGDVSSLPRGITYLNLGGNNSIGGDVSDLPSGLTSLICEGSNTLSGDVSGFPSGLTYVKCRGSNTISGNVSGLPGGLTYLDCLGANIISGDVSGMPSSLGYIYLAGSNTLSGDISAMPSSMGTFSCHGSNTVSGDIANIPNGMTYFNCEGNNTLSGNVGDLAGTVTAFMCAGNNTITGNLAGVPSLLNRFYCAGNNTVTYNTSSGGHAWPNTMLQVAIIPVASVFTSSMTDALLIDLSGSTSWVSYREIRLLGNCGARTSASDSAVTTLLSNSANVNTN